MMIARPVHHFYAAHERLFDVEEKSIREGTSKAWKSSLTVRCCGVYIAIAVGFRPIRPKCTYIRVVVNDEYVSSHCSVLASNFRTAGQARCLQQIPVEAKGGNIEFDTARIQTDTLSAD